MEQKIVLNGIAVPVMARDQFARTIGVDPGVVNGWCDRGYVPTIRIGKYSLINLFLLEKLLEKQDLQT